uniref:Predicted protein n=1 Tax=Hordeum vulgare subsp. vulgare TaxID=112509 RepID=F2DFB0_HORVV|nr:predicted protein [Hordeum vulgare subsp. vulgare]
MCPMSPPTKRKGASTTTYNHSARMSHPAIWLMEVIKRRCRTPWFSTGGEGRRRAYVQCVSRLDSWHAECVSRVPRRALVTASFRGQGLDCTYGSFRCRTAALGWKGAPSIDRPFSFLLSPSLRLDSEP